MTAIEVQTFDDLRKAFAEHRRQSGVRQLELDDIAGLQSGYTGKLECGTKRYGDMSLPCTLGALGLRLVVISRPATYLEEQGISITPIEGIKKLHSENGKKGNRVRWSKPMSSETRRRMRDAAKNRWAKVRAARKALAEKREKKYGRSPKAKGVVPLDGLAAQKPNDQK